MLDNLDFSVEFDEGKYAEVMRKVEQLANRAEIEKAINRAAKRAANEARKETAKLIAAEYTLDATEVKKSLSTRRLSSSRLGAAMDISSSSFALTKFTGVLPKEIMPPAKGPVRVQVKGSGNVAEFRRAFVAKMKSGHVGVYEREEEKRFDDHNQSNYRQTQKKKWHIEQYFGPSVPGMFGRVNETEINKAVRERAMVIFDEWVVTELEKLMYA